MADYITRQAQRVVDRVASAAIAEATRAYAKPLPADVQDIVVAAFSTLLPVLEDEGRQEEADFKAEQAERLAPFIANTSASSNIDFGFRALYGGSDPD